MEISTHFYWLNDQQDNAKTSFSKIKKKKKRNCVDNQLKLKFPFIFQHWKNYISVYVDTIFLSHNAWINLQIPKNKENTEKMK